MTIAEFYKKVDTSVAVAKIVFNYLSDHNIVKRIGSIAETSSGGTPTRGNPEFYNGTIPWLKSGELNDGLITECEEYITEKGLKNSSAKLFPEGTLLVAMYGATAGKVGILSFDASTNQAVCAVFPKADIERDFLFWYFRQQRFDFIEISKGGAQPNISQTVINNAVIPIPEVAVQKQVVKFLNILETEQRIDNNLVLNEEVAQQIARYFKIRTEAAEVEDIYIEQKKLLTQLRQSILQEAVQGKLTKKFRETEKLAQQDHVRVLGSNPSRTATPQLETGADLLARIRAEKAELIRQGKLRKEKPLPPITDAEKPFELPEGWVWCRLGDVCESSFYGPRFSNGDYIKNGIPTIRTTDMTDDGRIVLKNTPMVKVSSSKLELYQVLDGDLLITRSGSIGIMAVFRGSYTAIPSAYLIRFRFVSSIFPEYVFSVLKAPFWQRLMGLSTTSTAQVNINASSINSFLIPLPSFTEQQAIVAQVKQLLNQVSALEIENKQQQVEVSQLMQVVLSEAFAGKETALSA